MDITALASLATSMSSARTEDAVQMAVLKKAMDIQASSAAQLIGTLPTTANLPPHLGQTINTTA